MASNKENHRSVHRSFDSFRVNELKSYLRDHGEYVTGSKADLIKRAKGVEVLKKTPLSVIRLEDENIANERHLERFVTPLGEKLPDPRLLGSGWTSIMELNEFSRKDLYNYLVLSKKRTLDMETNSANRQLKAKVFYEDRHVHSLLFNDIDKDCSHCYIKGKVIPSLPSQNENQKPDYNVWVCLAKETGHVHSAGCNCSAGEGESCNHVSAVLHALVDVSRSKREGLDASTSKLCKWNQPRKRKLSPQKVQDLHFRKHKWEEEETTKRNKTKVKLDNRLSEVKPVNLDKFASKLRQCAPHAAWLLTREDTAVKDTETALTPNFHEINFNFSDKCDLNSQKEFFKSYFDSLTICQDECIAIEKHTRKQYKCNDWYKCRFGRITASQIGSICKRDKTIHPTSIINNICGYSPLSDRVKYVKWGRDHEPAARRQYSNMMKKREKGFEVSQSGLFVNCKFPHLGASPDGIIKCEGKVVGVLEVKCPWKWRFAPIKDAGKDTQFCCSLVGGKLNLKKTHIYYYQIQAQMALTDTKWCDFVLWTLKDFNVQRIDFDEVFWNQCLSSVNEFFVNFFLPELFSTRVKRGKLLY